MKIEDRQIRFTLWDVNRSQGLIHTLTPVSLIVWFIFTHEFRRIAIELFLEAAAEIGHI